MEKRPSPHEQRDLSLNREKSNPLDILAGQIEPTLHQCRTHPQVRLPTIFVVSSNERTRSILHRTLIYKGFDVVCFSRAADVKLPPAKPGPRAIILDIDSDPAAETRLPATDVPIAALTTKPAARDLPGRGFSLVVPIPFDPLLMTKSLRELIHEPS